MTDLKQRTDAERFAPVPDFCDYGVGVIGDRLAKLLTHTEGAKSGQDINAIHQMRVWSRRSRAALDVFDICFSVEFIESIQKYRTVQQNLSEKPSENVSKKLSGNLSKPTGKVRRHQEAVARKREQRAIHAAKAAEKATRARIRAGAESFARLKAEVKCVTQALGAARDLDVMVETLGQRAETLLPEHRAGVMSLIAHLQAQREGQQSAVTAAVAHLERHHLPDLLEHIADKFGYRSADSCPSEGQEQADNSATGGETGINALALLQNAGRLIEQRLEGLLDYVPYMANPDNVYELHEMRIAAKRLRYTMEIFAPIYTQLPGVGPDFTQALKNVKNLQEHLGVLHDADVLVPQLLEHQGRLLQVGFGMQKVAPKKGEEPLPIAGVHRVDYLACEGLLLLSTRVRDERDARYNLLLEDWEKIQKQEVFTGLRSLLSRAEQTEQTQQSGAGEQKTARESKEPEKSGTATAATSKSVRSDEVINNATIKTEDGESKTDVTDAETTQIQRTPGEPGHVAAARRRTASRTEAGDTRSLKKADEAQAPGSPDGDAGIKPIREHKRNSRPAPSSSSSKAAGGASDATVGGEDRQKRGRARRAKDSDSRDGSKDGSRDGNSPVKAGDSRTDGGIYRNGSESVAGYTRIGTDSGTGTGEGGTG